MQQLHVVSHKEELDPHRLEGKVIAVLDILFASTTMVTALAHGATTVIPCLDEAEARDKATRLAGGTYVLAGEKDAVIIDGFASFAPLALMEQGLAGKTLVYSTTNGTVALRRADGAKRVYAAALLNGDAVADEICRTTTGESVLVVCSGSKGRFNLEDFYGAGYLVECLTANADNRFQLSDAAMAARAIYAAQPAVECLRGSRVGRMVEGMGLTHETEFAAQCGTFSAVPQLVDGALLNVRR